MNQNQKVQVVVATMHQNDFSKFSKMNLASDVVFANQTNKTQYAEAEIDGFRVQMISTETRGVGINRNLGLQYASGDILLIADDDMTYEENYAETVRKAFEEIPDADAIIFNIKTIGKDMGRRMNKKISRVRIHNCLNYGAARIAVRKSSLVRERIFFSTSFGGGTIYSAGEDSLFICDMLKKGLKIYTHSATIASVDQTSSTWFCGYNKKFIYDKGAFFAAAFKKAAPAMCLQYILRHKKVCNDAKLSPFQAFRLMLQGGKGYKKLQEWKYEK